MQEHDLLTVPVPDRTLSAFKHIHDKGTPGESRGRKATGPRLLRVAPPDATKDHDRRAAAGVARLLSFA
jgi:hypothetical protein